MTNTPTTTSHTTQQATTPTIPIHHNLLSSSRIKEVEYIIVKRKPFPAQEYIIRLCKMPDTSDSEAFESADEDIVDSRPRKPEETVVKPVVDEGVLKMEPKRLEDSAKFSPADVPEKMVAEITTQGEPAPLKDDVENREANPVAEKSVSQTRDSLKKADDYDEIRVAKVEESIISSGKSGATHIPAESKPKEDNIEVSQSKDCAKTDDDDGWEFDDWGGDDTPIATKKVEIAPVAKSSDDDDVGWEVEDWGDEPQADEPKDNPKTETKSSNLFGNFSQLIISADPPKPASTPQTVNPLDRLSDSIDASSNWGWKPWGGVVNLLSTATDGVASITSHVSSVIESGIGVPDPAEMARLQREERQKRLLEQPPKDDDSQSIDAPEEGGSSRSNRGDDATVLLGQFVTGMTHIGNRVITGGLDTLEGIGKKTMTILKENDKGLLDKQRKMLMEGQGPALSQVIDYKEMYIL